jgi:predicted DNA-binding protein with PD1-like motif
MSVQKSSLVNEYVVKIPYDSDLLLTIKETVVKLGITSGVITVIGALRRAVLYYYLQEQKTFQKNVFERPLEIASGIGNIAVKDGETIVHLHVVLADKDGTAFGGHLAEGSRVFAGEVWIRALSPMTRRKFDPQTGLNLYEI